MLRRIIILILGTLLTAHPFADVLQTADPVESAATERHKSPAGAIIAVSLIAAAAGAGGYFFFRKRMRERQHADSVITAVERTWDSAAVSYTHEQYHDAVRQLQSISGRWYEYEKYSTRFKTDRRVNPDSIKAIIASCDFLERMIAPVKALSEFAEQLPADEFALSKFNRHDLLAARQYLRRSMDSIMTAHSNNRTALKYCFRPIDRRLQSFDSLTEASFDQQQADFAAKARFYYNRAAAADDSLALRNFVADCDYYQIDKEWCQRARLILNEKGTASPPAVPQRGKLTVKDSMQVAYAEAVQSKRIEVLEAYIGRYSARRYRSILKDARLDSARIVLKSLRAIIDSQMSLNRTYPRFGGDATEIPIDVKGLSTATGNIFSTAWSALKPDLDRLPAIRLPARLTIDYTHAPPILLLDAYVSPTSDIEQTTINFHKSYRVTCLQPAMQLLQRLKARAISLINDAEGTQDKTNTVIDYETKKVSTATYVVRLAKPGGGTILFYAHDQSSFPNDSSGPIQFYDFYDIATSGNETKRFPIYSGSLPEIMPSLAPDSLEQTMGEQFFGE